MRFRTDDVRIDSLRPLIPPAILMEELPLGDDGSSFVTQSRAAVASVVHGRDDRLLVITGPCSIHDPAAAFEYAKRLQRLAEAHAESLLVVMRVYFEKPRTIVGWKGLINDPDLDGSFAINKGLRLARKLLIDLCEMRLPAGTEFLDPITPQFFADLVAWGAIGARTSESQVHRELASGLSMPVGLKNATDGSVQVAIDAVRSAAHAHHFLSVTKQGVAAIVATLGNRDCHVILRGGTSGPNYSRQAVDAAAEKLVAAGLPPRVIVDCSHANSEKDPMRQVVVASDLAEQIRTGSARICGVMLESFLEAGRQSHEGRRELVFGQSITDACIGWGQTEEVLAELAEAARLRRERLGRTA